jgi:hypothetical protein
MDTGVGDSHQRIEWHGSIRQSVDACHIYLFYLDSNSAWQTGGIVGKPCGAGPNTNTGSRGGASTAPRQEPGASQEAARRAAEAETQRRAAEAEKQKRAGDAARQAEYERQRLDLDQRRQQLAAEEQIRLRRVQEEQARLQWQELQRRAEQQRREAIEREQARVRAEQAARERLFASQQEAIAAGQAAALEGVREGREAAERSNEAKRARMVDKVAREWRPPKDYSTDGARSVGLVDPFAPESADAKPRFSLAELKSSIEGSCLEIDEVRAVARIKSDCLGRGQLRPGDYPFTDGEGLLSSPASIAAFLESLKRRDGELKVIRGNEVVTVRPALRKKG